MLPHPSSFGSATDLDALAALKVSSPAHASAAAPSASPAMVAGARFALGKSPLSGASPGSAHWCAGKAPRTSPVSVLMIPALNLSVDTDADADDGMDWDADADPDDDARTPITPAGPSVFAFDRAPAARRAAVAADATTPIAGRRPPAAFARSPPPPPARPTLGASRSFNAAEFFPGAGDEGEGAGAGGDDADVRPAETPRADAAAVASPSSLAASPFARSDGVQTVAEVAETSFDMFTSSDADVAPDDDDDDDAPFIARRRVSDEDSDDEDFPSAGRSPSCSNSTARAMDFGFGGGGGLLGFGGGAGLTVSVPGVGGSGMGPNLASNASAPFASATSPPAAPGKSSSARRLRRMGSLAETKLLAQAGLARTSSINLGRGAPGGEEASFRFHDHFYFLRPIGRGGASEAWLVKSKLSGERYCVKQIVAKFRTQSERDRCLHEVEAVTYLPPHPNVVKYHRAWQENRHFFAQMELCECGSFGGCLSRLPPGRLVDERDIWLLAAQTAAGLSHCHDYGILHLDVKPDNVFLDRAGTYKIGDFGVAWVAGKGWEIQDGDGGYVAPETLTADATTPPTAAADVFSLGATLYEAATGNRLPPELRRGLLEAGTEGGGGAGGGIGTSRSSPSSVALPEGRSRELATVIAMCLARDPTLRPSAGDVSRHAAMIASQYERLDAEA